MVWPRGGVWWPRSTIFSLVTPQYFVSLTSILCSATLIKRKCLGGERKDLGGGGGGGGGGGVLYFWVTVEGGREGRGGCHFSYFYRIYL